MVNDCEVEKMAFEVMGWVVKVPIERNFRELTRAGDCRKGYLPLFTGSGQIT